jgi:hypothetical protein
MKTIGVADLGTLKNELRKYKHGRKLDIRQFNQAARLAWLGLLTLSPLERRDFYLAKFFRAGGDG